MARKQEGFQGCSFYLGNAYMGIFPRLKLTELHAHDLYTLQKVYFYEKRMVNLKPVTVKTP